QVYSLRPWRTQVGGRRLRPVEIGGILGRRHSCRNPAASPGLIFPKRRNVGDDLIVDRRSAVYRNILDRNCIAAVAARSPTGITMQTDTVVCSSISQLPAGDNSADHIGFH